MHGLFINREIERDGGFFSLPIRWNRSLTLLSPRPLRTQIPKCDEEAYFKGILWYVFILINDFASYNNFYFSIWKCPWPQLLMSGKPLNGYFVRFLLVSMHRSGTALEYSEYYTFCYHFGEWGMFCFCSIPLHESGMAECTLGKAGMTRRLWGNNTEFSSHKSPLSTVTCNPTAPAPHTAVLTSELKPAHNSINHSSFAAKSSSNKKWNTVLFMISVF